MARNALLLFALALGIAPLPVLAADHVELRAALAARTPGARIDEIRALPHAGLYEVVVNGLNVFYTDARGEIALVGELIELSTGRHLTKERVAQLRTVDFSRLPLDKAIVKVKGTGARRMAVFSDPDCPYCKQLERELTAITNVTIYTFLLPLPALHPDAVRKAEMVWCAADRAGAWDTLMLAGREPAASSCETPIRDIAQAAEALNISGTPGIVFGNGRLVPGALTRTEIEQHLNAPAARSPIGGAPLP